jgi:hypothetical protein
MLIATPRSFSITAAFIFTLHCLRRRLTAATVIDLTDEVTVGKYIMFFHGSSKEGMRAQRAHGAASLALAWSDDLVNWSWPR